MKEKNLKDTLTYKDAARRCRLTEKEIEMAKIMKISPRGLIRNIPARSGRKEKWKDVPGLWIRRIYEPRDPRLKALASEARIENRRMNDAYTRLVKNPRCHLNEAELCMARRLSLPPLSLLTAGCSPGVPWAVPPALRVRRLFDSYDEGGTMSVPGKEPEA